GIDVVLDPVGAGYLAENIQMLGIGGRLVLIGLMGGAKTEIDLAQLMIKRARVIGSTLRPRTLGQKAAVMSELEELVWPKLAAGEIKPIIEQCFPIEEVSAAHDLVASDTTIGKVILEVD
ncbi:MAG: zinc-binding dehydrogenase, partial [Pseudomonadales bacterium]